MSRPSEIVVPEAHGGAAATPALASVAGSRVRLYNVAILVILILASAATFHFRATIAGNFVSGGPNFVYPYFAGAARLDSSLKWTYDPEGLQVFRRLSVDERFAFDFSPRAGESRRDYRYNNIGYVFVIWFADHLFPFLSAISAVVAFQCLVHAVTTYFVATSLGSPVYRALFVAGYGLNPLVLHFVASPFYYYLQVLPSVVLLVIVQRSLSTRLAPVVYAALFLSYILRPSTLPLILLTMLVVLVKNWSRARVLHAVLAAALVIAIGLARQPTVPWHTAYVGLGAYENPYVAGLSDENGYGFYKKVRGVDIVTDLPHGNFYDPVVRNDYFDVVKARYMEIVTADAPMLLRNAFYNLLQSFSIGYVIGRPSIQIASAVVGLAVIAALWYSQQWLLIVALGAASAGTAVFFPPIPAYMNGNYLLLAFGGVKALQYHVGRGTKVPRYGSRDGSRHGVRSAGL